MARNSRESPQAIVDLFAALKGESFSGEAEFQRAVTIAFNARLHEFPPHYSYRDAISWAVRQQWILVEGAEIAVSLPALTDVGPPPLALAA
jgi:hypothetical protein